MKWVQAPVFALGICLVAGSVASLDRRGEAVELVSTEGEIKVDGRLDEAAWLNAAKVETWFETNPGDSVPAKHANQALLIYDERFLYIGFEFPDPDPSAIRAPLSDRDNLPGDTDYGGVILDTQNDGRTAQMFLANPRGIQSDAISSDVSGEDNAPNFFWDSAATIHDGGWTLEIRIPFSSLRYREADPEEWGILLYRNYPRDYRYQMFNTPLPRDVNCFICNASPLRGLKGLPQGSHYIVAPFATGSIAETAVDGAGSELVQGDLDTELGLDAKWIPNPDTIVDLTINPDFQQVESDVAQVSTNQRFALFFPERRPFFLEGVDLFRTPFRAVYTRNVTQPNWGARITGKTGGLAFTALVSEDDGGGVVIIPGANESSFAAQDFSSHVLLARLRQDLGERSFLGFLMSAREIDGGGYNRVFGPDLEWRPTDVDRVRAQFLWADSETPNRPDLSSHWDGRELSGHAFKADWSHNTPTVDWFFQTRHLDEEFRADNGFEPQVGVRGGYFDTGYTFRFEDSYLHRLRTYFIAENTEDLDGELIFRQFSPGFGFSAKKNTFGRFRVAFDEVRAGTEVFDRVQLHSHYELSPGKVFSTFSISGVIGDEVDFANSRKGEGGSFDIRAVLRPTDQLEIQLNGTRSWLDVDPPELYSGRLFTADVLRLRAVWTFSARSWLRGVVQRVATEREPDLYTFDVSRDREQVVASLVFAYKLNWQTVVYLGLGDERQLDAVDRLEPVQRRAFLKVSYAFQR